MSKYPFIVGIGGTTRENSSSEDVLRRCLKKLEGQGARTRMYSGHKLILPMYQPGVAAHDPAVRDLIDSIRRSDALIIASPGYHGSVSGMIKNALDYIEELRDDARPYLSGRAVGCVSCAYGWQAAVSTLTALRSISHALRGWPTPMGAAINTAKGLFDEHGEVEPEADRQLKIMCEQVLEFLGSRGALDLQATPEVTDQSPLLVGSCLS